MYGSLVNMIGAASVKGQPKPEVGMGVTFYFYSDRSPGTIVEILTPNKIVVQGDDYVRTDNNGFSESQTYKITPNPNASKIIFRLRKNGRWVKNGEPMKGGLTIGLGHRDAYYDSSF